jgi:phosphatidylinositol alpha-mannosyltransferase
VRVCIVTPYDLSHDGGVNRHAVGLANGLCRLGHEARVVGPASGELPEGCDRIGPALPVPSNGSLARIGLFVSHAAMRDYLARGGFDLVHVHEPIVPGPGRHALRHARVPVVATFHANDERELPLVRALRAAASGALVRVDYGIAVSRAAKAFSRAVYRGRTAVIPNGVDLSRFARGGGDACERRGPLRLLFVGRFGEARKGFRLLLEAVALLRRAGDEVSVDVVGAGPEERFAARAGRLGLRFHGRLPDAALAARYRAADVFCAPSLRGESFGMVLLEAMAAGCPVVASDLPGYAEAARGAALLVRAGDAGALAGAVRAAGHDPDLRATLVQKGRARAGALSWTWIASRVLDVYRRAGGADRGALDATA